MAAFLFSCLLLTAYRYCLLRFDYDERDIVARAAPA